jgi:hypothetical protein
MILRQFLHPDPVASSNLFGREETGAGPWSHQLLTSCLIFRGPSILHHQWAPEIERSS